MKEKQYITTKEKCQESIDFVHLVCTHCGGEREPIETVDSAGNPTYWAGCTPCSIFNAGCTPEDYKAASFLVDNMRWITYDHLGFKIDSDEGYEHWREVQISGAVTKINEYKRALNMLNQ